MPIAKKWKPLCKIWYNSLMKPTKESIIAYLEHIKPDFAQKGISDLALFGSFATMQEGVYSDLDIAVRKAPDYFDRYTAYDYFETIEALKTVLRKKFHRNIDILDLDSASPYIERIKEEMIVV